MNMMYVKCQLGNNKKVQLQQKKSKPIKSQIYVYLLNVF